MKKRFLFVVKAIPFLSVAFFLVFVSAVAIADWQKTNTPPDVDKAHHLHGNKPTCWMAAASNMLAGAGYGDGNDIQERADDIYLELWSHLVDGNHPGWADTAIDAWLHSAYNTWGNSNPYSVVTVRGRTYNRYPWASTELPKIVGNELRDCHYVRLGIRKPTCDSNIGKGGHAITAWGDSGDSNDLTGNPSQVKVTDSDFWNQAQDVQTYTYDDFNDPNPIGNDCNEGVGWYINYSNSDNHRYIDDIVILSDTGEGNNPGTQTVVGSYKIHQNNEDANATDLHSTIAAGVDILGYRISVDVDVNEPDIGESGGPPPTSLSVDWDFPGPVPHCTWVTITAELIEPYDPNTSNICMANTYFTYPLVLEGKAEFIWDLRTPELPGGMAMYEPNMCGGYVVCAFDIYKDTGTSMDLVGKFRSQHRYRYCQSPEIHEYMLAPAGPESEYWAQNFRFGHSYGFLDDDELWQFSDWLSQDYTMRYMAAPTGWIPVPPWPPLPYPQGQDYTTDIPEKCGDPGTPYQTADINKDCYVNLKDLAVLGQEWLKCTDPNNAACAP